MIVNYVYEYDNGDVDKLTESFINSKNIVIENIINKFKGNNDNDPKCWIYHITTMTWIACTNNLILSYLIEALIKENNNDSNITILVRENHNSPNRTPILYFDNKSVSNNSFQSELSILNKIEPFTRSLIDKIDDKSSLIEIPSNKYLGGGYLLDSDYLIDFLKSKLYMGEEFFRIGLYFENSKNNSSEEIIFTNDIWTKYFVRCNVNSEELLIFFSEIFKTAMEYRIEIKKFHENTDLFERVKILIYDLLKFNSNNDSEKRLCSISVNNPGYYFNPSYFTENEIEYLINFPTSSGLILKNLLDIFRKMKFEEGITEVCSSHDIAPILYKVFEIRKGFDKDKNFIKFVKKFKSLV